LAQPIRPLNIKQDGNVWSVYYKGWDLLRYFELNKKINNLRLTGSFADGTPFSADVVVDNALIKNKTQ
jgi:hypothetical protein